MKIIAIRKIRHFSQSQAAERSIIPIRTYQRIESGETSPSIDYLNRLAEGFGCSVSDLLHFDLETNEFPLGHIPELSQKYHALEEENGRLRQFVDWLTEQLRGRGGRNVFQIAYWFGFAESWLNGYVMV